MTRPRLLIISSAKNFGGGEAYLRKIVDELRSDYVVTILGPRFIKNFIGDRVETLWLPLFPTFFDRLLRRTHRLKRLYYRLLIGCFYNFDRYDAINIQWFDGALIEAIRKRPLMLTLHVDFIISRDYDTYVARVLNSLDKIICVSGEAKKQLVKRGVNSTKCIVIHNGVDPASFKYNGQPGQYVTWIGRVEKAQKNPDLFLQIAQLAYKQGSPLRFRMVGDGNRLGEINKKRSPNLALLGSQKPQAMAKIYRQASVLCMTSFYEGLPFVALEAMACGVPVISTAVSGPNELLTDGTGILITQFDAKKFLTEISSLARDTSRYEHMREKARKRIEKDFSINNTVQQTLAVYHDLVQQKDLP